MKLAFSVALLTALVAASIAAPQLATPQPQASFDNFRHGTVVVAGALDDEALIAADSRGKATHDKFDDKDCKLSNYSGKVIFGSAGLRRLGMSIDGKRQDWDSHVIARQAATAAFASHSESPAKAAAEGWRDRALDLFTKALKGNPEGFVRMFAPAGALKDNFTQAVFADVENGRARIFLVELHLAHPPQQLPSIHAKFEELPQQNATVMSFNSVTNEFISGQNPKFNQIKIAWQSSLGFISPHDYYFRYLNQLAVWSVEFASDFYVGEPVGVGGAVDVVDIRPSGVRWLSRKPNCKEVE
jgi:hypothetical protein